MRQPPLSRVWYYTSINQQNQNQNQNLAYIGQV